MLQILCITTWGEKSKFHVNLHPSCLPLFSPSTRPLFSSKTISTRPLNFTSGHRMHYLTKRDLYLPRYLTTAKTDYKSIFLSSVFKNRVKMALAPMRMRTRHSGKMCTLQTWATWLILFRSCEMLGIPAQISHSFFAGKLHYAVTMTF